MDMFSEIKELRNRAWAGEFTPAEMGDKLDDLLTAMRDEQDRKRLEALDNLPLCTWK